MFLVFYFEASFGLNITKSLRYHKLFVIPYLKSEVFDTIIAFVERFRV